MAAWATLCRATEVAAVEVVVGVVVEEVVDHATAQVVEVAAATSTQLTRDM
jgi:hypothetical protein